MFSELFLSLFDCITYMNGKFIEKKENQEVCSLFCQNNITIPQIKR